MQEPEDKKQGIAHLFAAGGYSLAGFNRALQESAFRQEIAFFLASLACSPGSAPRPPNSSASPSSSC
jgi:diacylglycerol kinase